MLTWDRIAETGKANLDLIFEVGTKAAEDLGKLAALNKRCGPLGTRTEFARIGTVQCETYGRQMKSVVEHVTRNAPTGSEAVVTALDSATAAAHTLYETLRSSGQQVVQATRGNLEISEATAKSVRRAIDPVTQAAKP